MAIPELIFCADGNKRFAEIAIEAGFLYGAQLPKTIYFEPYFVDQDFKRPNFRRYLEEVRRYRPAMASVLDWELEAQLPDVLAQAEQIAAYVDTVMIIPKVVGGVNRVPAEIGGKPVRLGYSVPTSFGGTALPIWEFNGRPIHLLGGSPANQFILAKYMNVVSLDGNYAGMKARRFCEYWDGRRWIPDGRRTEWDAPYEAFRRSCQNIMTMWRGLK